MEESSAAFSLVYILAICLVLDKVSETSTTPPVLGDHFSLLYFPVTDLPFVSLILKINK